MLIVAALLFMVYGYSQIAYKDFWWWDKHLLFQYFGVTVQRNAAWERQQNRWGWMWVLAGSALLGYAALAFML